MSEVIGIKETNTNQISYIKTNQDFELESMVVVDSGKGEFIYQVVREKEQFNPLAHKIFDANSIRTATSDELLVYLKNQELKAQYNVVFKQMTKELGVNAMLINTDISLEGDHIKYTYFSLEKLRFPVLIKYLLNHNPKRLKIEFYQVGEREYYAINGGLGVCGYELCCHERSYNTPTITTSSLKKLGININLKKSLTGSCGKYKCCTLFNIGDKEALKENLPDIDTQITYNGQRVTVTGISFKQNKVTVLGAEIIELDFNYFTGGYNDSNK